MPTRPDGAAARGLSQAAIAARVAEVVARVSGGATPAPASESFRGDSWVRLPREHALATLAELRRDPELAFDVLLDVTCVHWPRRKPPLGAFDVVYHLVSVSKGHRFRLKVACPDPELGVDSACSVWEGANLMEREAYDMFGVRFQGHPDLRRVLMPEEYEGWPLRKDFPYRGH